MTPRMAFPINILSNSMSSSPVREKQGWSSTSDSRRSFRLRVSPLSVSTSLPLKRRKNNTEEMIMRAIDVHIHVPEPSGDSGAEEQKQMAGYFKATALPKSPEEMYEKYKSLDIFGVIFSVDSETRAGAHYVGNDYVAEVARKYSGQFIGFASVDPWKGAIAIRELERAVKELGLRGLKLHPTVQAFFPNDTRFYP